jgi:hypothetical protein
MTLSFTEQDVQLIRYYENKYMRMAIEARANSKIPYAVRMRQSVWLEHCRVRAEQLANRMEDWINGSNQQNTGTESA